MIEQVKTEGITKVVSADELELATLEGWRLMAIVQGNEVVPCRDTVPDPRPDAYSGQTVEVLKHAPSVRTLFVVGFDEQSSIGKLTGELKDARKIISDAAKQHDEDKRAVANHDEVVADLNKREADVRQLYHDARNELNTLRDSSQKMESDLAAIRGSLGTKQFDLIIAEAKERAGVE